MSFVDQTVQDNSDIASSYIAGRSVENRLLKVIVLKPKKKIIIKYSFRM